MSRPDSSTRPRTTDHRQLDLAQLQKAAWYIGYTGRWVWMREGREVASICYAIEPAGLRLLYSVTSCGPTENINELVPIVTTPMHLGGQRRWFTCPSCRRRCRLLYLGGARFRCRRCRGAVYESQYEHPILRMSSARWRIRDHLAKRGSRLPRFHGLDDGFPDKPPRMHWRTYRRLEARDRQLAGAWCDAVGGWLEQRDLQRSRPARQLAVMLQP
jgi:hypothetical protein